MPQTVDFQAFLDSAPDWHKQLTTSPRPPADQLHAVWEKSCKEQELGILREWHDEEFFDAKFGRGRWRAMKRFAVWQPNANDWRVIDNGLSSDHNDAVQAYKRSTQLRPH